MHGNYTVDVKLLLKMTFEILLDKLVLFKSYSRHLANVSTWFVCFQVPRVFINGNCIGGGSDTKQLHQQGKLLPLIEQCSPCCSPTSSDGSSSGQFEASKWLTVFVVFLNQIFIKCLLIFTLQVLHGLNTTMLFIYQCVLHTRCLVT